MIDPCFMNRNSPRQKIADLLAQCGLDALVFFATQNLRYLSGFSGTDGVIIATAEKMIFLTDSRYTTQALEEVSADAVEEYNNKIEAVVRNLEDAEVKKIGVETSLAIGVFEELQEKGRPEWFWVNLKDNLNSLRMHKSSEEIDRITQAAELNFVAFNTISGMVRPGVKEADIAIALEHDLRNRGAEEKAFDIIVASGERGALPHGIASNKVVREAELVTIDFGCRISGYYSDETVTLAVGEISHELRAVYDTVLEAHDRAISATAPGVPLVELDHIARDHIKSCGYGKYFGHGLGHGVGLEVHEAPVVSPRSSLVAEEGMVFTIEPGIYIPGTGGVRIEDMVLVTEKGCRVLTKIPKKFSNILLN